MAFKRSFHLHRGPEDGQETPRILGTAFENNLVLSCLNVGAQSNECAVIFELLSFRFPSKANGRLLEATWFAPPACMDWQSEISSTIEETLYFTQTSSRRRRSSR